MIDVGRSKRAQQAFALMTSPSFHRGTYPRGGEVSLQWRIDAYTFAFPLLAAPMDSVMSPATAIKIGQLGGLGVLNLEGLDPLRRPPAEAGGDHRDQDPPEATRRMQRIYAEPIKPELIGKRVAEIREAGVPTAGALSPQNTQAYAQAVVDSGVDFFVIRGTTVSAEHVSSELEPLNLKNFIYELDVPVIVGGCATYQAALHLMRTGAAGVLVGFGGGAAYTSRSVLGVAVPMASAVCRRAARRDYLTVWRPLRSRHRRRLGRTLRRYAKAIACGAVCHGPARRWPGRGSARTRFPHWGSEGARESCPAASSPEFSTVGDLQHIMLGPSSIARRHHEPCWCPAQGDMATTGYTEIRSSAGGDRRRLLPPTCQRLSVL
jgi:IMP dehydrogenase